MNPVPILASEPSVTAEHPQAPADARCKHCDGPHEPRQLFGVNANGVTTADVADVDHWTCAMRRPRPRRTWRTSPGGPRIVPARQRPPRRALGVCAEAQFAEAGEVEVALPYQTQLFGG